MQEEKIALCVLRKLYRAPERASSLMYVLSKEGVSKRRVVSILNKMYEKHLIKNIEKDESKNRLWMLTRQGYAFTEKHVFSSLK
ncbi:MAG: hypothetical protein QXT63_00655 [Thermoplasmata archaeon]